VQAAGRAGSTSELAHPPRPSPVEVKRWGELRVTPVMGAGQRLQWSCCLWADVPQGLGEVRADVLHDPACSKVNPKLFAQE